MEAGLVSLSRKWDATAFTRISEHAWDKVSLF